MALSRLNEWVVARRRRIVLVYLTGRHHSSACQLIEDAGLLLPDILVHDVGTGIRYAPCYHPDPAWHRQVRQNWHPKEVREHLSILPGLSPQPVPGDLRVSFFTAGPSESLARKAARILRRAGLAAHVIASGGNLLDVLPARAGKGSALAYLQRYHRWRPATILVCGDTGNDRDMLSLGFPGVVVGNASPELKAASLPPTVYRALGAYAAGIWEALQYRHSWSTESSWGRMAALPITRPGRP